MLETRQQLFHSLVVVDVLYQMKMQISSSTFVLDQCVTPVVIVVVEK